MKVRWACGARRGLVAAAGCALAGVGGIAAAFALVHGANAATVPTTIPGTVSVSTPVVTTAVSTPLVTTTVSTPVVTTAVSTPVVTTAVSTPVATTTVATPVATTSVSTPAVSATVAPSPSAGSPGMPALPGTAAPSGSPAGGSAGTAGSAPPSSGGIGASDGESTGTAGGTPAGTAARADLRPSPRGSRRPARLVLRLDRAARVLLVFRGPGWTCDVAGTLRVRAGRGATAVPLTGRVRGGRLPEGVFRLEAYTLAPGGARTLVGTVVLSLAYDASGHAAVRPVERRLPACRDASGGLFGGRVLVVGERYAAAPSSAGDAGDAEAQAGGAAGVGGGSSSAPGAGEGSGRAGLPSFLDGPEAVGGAAAWIFAGLTAASLLLFLGLLGSYVVRTLRS